MTEIENQRPSALNRWPLYVVLLTPLLVMAAASWLYASGAYRPAEQSNHGTLLQPVLSSTDLALPKVMISDQRQWQLVQFSPSCEQSCFERLIEQRQIHKAMGKLAPRISRTLLTSGSLATGLSRDELPNLEVVQHNGQSLSGRAEATGTGGRLTSQSGFRDRSVRQPGDVFHARSGLPRSDE